MNKSLKILIVFIVILFILANSMWGYIWYGNKTILDSYTSEIASLKNELIEYKSREEDQAKYKSELEDTITGKDSIAYFLQNYADKYGFTSNDKYYLEKTTKYVHGDNHYLTNIINIDGKRFSISSGISSTNKMLIFQLNSNKTNVDMNWPGDYEGYQLSIREDDFELSLVSFTPEGSGEYHHYNNIEELKSGENSFYRIYSDSNVYLYTDRVTFDKNCGLMGMLNVNPPCGEKGLVSIGVYASCKVADETNIEKCDDIMKSMSYVSY